MRDPVLRFWIKRWRFKFTARYCVAWTPLSGGRHHEYMLENEAARRRARFQRMRTQMAKLLMPGSHGVALAPIPDGLHYEYR